jgi:hypothetical protein
MLFNQRCIVKFFYIYRFGISYIRTVTGYKGFKS